MSRLFSKSVCRPENVQSGQIVRNPGTTTLEKYKSQEMLIFENLCKSQKIFMKSRRLNFEKWKKQFLVVKVEEKMENTCKYTAQNSLVLHSWRILRIRMMTKSD